MGNFHFQGQVSKEVQDEIVAVGLTILYVMVTRMNNPLNILGSVFGKAERVGKEGEEGVEMQGMGGGPEAKKIK